MMRKFFVFLLFLIPILVFGLDIKFTMDDAHVLMQDSISYVEDYSAFLEENSQISYYVVTTPKLEMDFLEYVDTVVPTITNSNNYLLILFIKDVKKVRVVAGGELSEILTSEIIDETLDLYFMPYMKNDDWDKALMNGYKAFYKIICNYYDIDSSSMVVFDGLDFFTKYRYYILLFITAISMGLGYGLCTFFKKSSNSFLAVLLFTVGVFFNIVMFIFLYSLRPMFVFVVLACEFAAIVKSYNTQPGLSLAEAFQRIEEVEKKKELRKKKKKKTR